MFKILRRWKKWSWGRWVLTNWYGKCRECNHYHATAMLGACPRCFSKFAQALKGALRETYLD